MGLLMDKIREVLRTLMPVVAIVLILSFTIVDVSSDVLVRFLIGALMLLIGLGIFLYGVDISMGPIGTYMSREVATSKNVIRVLMISFLLGFLITVAEPDLLILGNQIEAASGGTLGSTLIVWIVSFGVGVVISLGVLSLLKGRPLNRFMSVIYAIIFVLALFVSEEFLAISFDASGATTGALTTPFILALSMGLSKMIGGKSSEENSFGLVGVMSTGPILAILLLSIFTGQSNIQGAPGEYVFTEGVLGPIIEMLPHTFAESLFALMPISILFFLFIFFKFKLKKEEMLGIIKGLVLLVIGLALFLTGVNSGFMDMGRIIGMQLAEINHLLLIGVAFVMGLIVVLVEPAVHVLGEQIEEVTSGAIPTKIIKTTLSIGVGIAIALSMVRIVVPEVKLWYFLLPGFLISIYLSYRVKPIFVGIAYDAGGVASGPMTATFVLAFAQGAATSIPTANVLVDGFGIIAMVAMTPVLSIMILGMLFKRQEIIEKKTQVVEELEMGVVVDDEVEHDNVLVFVNRGYSERVVEIARSHGATGATIMNARGTDDDQEVRLALLNLEVQPEKEIVMFIMQTAVSDAVAGSLYYDEILQDEGHIRILITPADIMVETFANPS
ncbi:MAG: DUF1538 domain-containing protein [Erysipelothrix sp.]|nr:DUF1538 domain-containing protein [Erysipelothrix sp.]